MFEANDQRCFCSLFEEGAKFRPFDLVLGQPSDPRVDGVNGWIDSSKVCRYGGIAGHVGEIPKSWERECKSVKVSASFKTQRMKAFQIFLTVLISNWVLHISN